MSSRLARIGPWITGIVLCLLGVLLVRVPLFGSESWVAAAAGYALAGLGLLRIAVGVRARLDLCEPPTSSPERTT